MIFGMTSRLAKHVCGNEIGLNQLDTIMPNAIINKFGAQLPFFQAFAGKILDQRWHVVKIDCN